MTAHSSVAAMTRSFSARAWLIAMPERLSRLRASGSCLPTSRRRSATVAPSDNSTSAVLSPARSAIAAKSLTRIIMLITLLSDFLIFDFRSITHETPQGATESRFQFWKQTISIRKILDRVERALAAPLFHLNPASAALGGTEQDAWAVEFREHPGARRKRGRVVRGFQSPGSSHPRATRINSMHAKSGNERQQGRGIRGAAQCLHMTGNVMAECRVKLAEILAEFSSGMQLPEISCEFHRLGRDRTHVGVGKNVEIVLCEHESRRGFQADNTVAFAGEIGEYTHVAKRGVARRIQIALG